MSLFAIRWYIDQGLPDDEIAIKLGISVERVRRIKRSFPATANGAGTSAEA